MPDVLARLAEIERRLAILEKHSHPPVDLTRPVHHAITSILREAAQISADRLCDD